jgi:hypothetical protein
MLKQENDCLDDKITLKQVKRVLRSSRHYAQFKRRVSMTFVETKRIVGGDWGDT